MFLSTPWKGPGLIKQYSLSILLPSPQFFIRPVRSVITHVTLPPLPCTGLSLFVWNVLFFSLSVCLFQPDAFTQCLFAEPVSFRNHLLIWIYGCRWVDTTKYRGSWAHFLNEHLFCFLLLLFFFFISCGVKLTLMKIFYQHSKLVHFGVQTPFEPESVSVSYTRTVDLHNHYFPCYFGSFLVIFPDTIVYIFPYHPFNSF